MKANAVNWSEASKRSVSYDFAPTHYSDIEYQCYRCGEAAVFSAEEQKEAFEVKKQHVWQRRNLCEHCFLKRRELEREVAKFESSWAQNKAALAKDRDALERWKEVLETLPYYGASRNTAHINMLKKVLQGEA